jgi:hypothetical protein
MVTWPAEGIRVAVGVAASWEDVVEVTAGVRSGGEELVPGLVDLELVVVKAAQALMQTRRIRLHTATVPKM